MEGKKDLVVFLNIVTETAYGEGRRLQEESMVSLDSLEIQLTVAYSINYALEYFLSLGEIEKIERSKVADYTIFYKDGKRLEVECKYCTEKNAQVTKVEKLDIL